MVILKAVAKGTETNISASIRKKKLASTYTNIQTYENEKYLTTTKVTTLTTTTSMQSKRNVSFSFLFTDLLPYLSHM